MRSIGVAEKALELMVRRGLNREAFGKPLANLGKNTEVIAKARIEIEAMRLMVLRAAKAMDVMGNPRPACGSAPSRRWCRCGCARSSTRPSRSTAPPASRSGPRWRGCTPAQRTLRLADGPDEVHWHVVGRAELTRYEDDHETTVGPTRTVQGVSFSGPS